MRKKINPLEYSIGTSINNWKIIGTIVLNKWNKKTVLCECKCGKQQFLEISKLKNTFECRNCYLRHKKENAPDKTIYKRYWNIYKKYKMSEKEFCYMWEKQQAKCCICGNILQMPTKTQGQGLDIVAVDHCHTTGKVRGLLCNRCNKGIGFLKDDINILENAIKYLKNETFSNNSSNI